MSITERFTHWIGNFRWLDAAVALGIFLLFLLLRTLFIRYMYAFALRKITRFQGIVTVLEALNKPLRFLLLVIGAYVSLRYFAGGLWGSWLWTIPIFRSLTILVIGWALYNLSSSSSVLIEGVGRRFGLDSTSMLIPFLSRFLRIMLVLLTLAAIASEWGFNVNGVVAGMGLGSLAIALAAQDTLGNIFGGVVLIVEKPFVRGDWIKTPETEGIVEDITFRSTKIRTFDDSLVIIPNAKLSDQSITNWSEMGHRRINFNLEVAIDADPDHLRRAVERMQREVEDNAGIDAKSVQVKFNAFGSGSLKLLFNCFTTTTVWAEYLVTLQEINLMILRVLREEGVGLAMPARRVVLDAESGMFAGAEGMPGGNSGSAGTGAAGWISAEGRTEPER